MKNRKKIRVYFISYSHQGGHGNCEITTGERGLSSYEDLQKTGRIIEETEKVEKVIILNFIELEEMSDIAKKNLRSAE